MLIEDDACKERSYKQLENYIQMSNYRSYLNLKLLVNYDLCLNLSQSHSNLFAHWRWISIPMLGVVLYCSCTTLYTN